MVIYFYKSPGKTPITRFYSRNVDTVADCVFKSVFIFYVIIYVLTYPGHFYTEISLIIQIVMEKGTVGYSMCALSGKQKMVSL